MVLGCDNFTEVDLPSDQLTTVSTFEDPATATAALSSIYANLRETGFFSGNSDGLSLLAGMYSDELTFFGSGASDMESFYTNGLLPGNTFVNSLWSSAYSRIYSCNALIEGVSQSSRLDVATKNQITGEALFLRALEHSYLAMLYGDIPYATQTDYRENAVLPKKPFAQVLEMAKADLEQAIALLPENYPTAERIRANRFAATALLSRVLLWMGDYIGAENNASIIIGQPSLYSLPADLGTTFLKESPSTLLQLHPGIAGANTNDARNFVLVAGPPAVVALSGSLVDAFETGDARKNLWTGTVTDGTSTWYFPYKYKQNSVTANSQEYPVVLRLEEQFLIRAEARLLLEDLQGAKQDLDLLRIRAGLSPLPLTDAQAMMQALMQERRVELFSELGHRFFDLKRRGMATPVLQPLKPSWQDTDLLLPLPQNELLLNNNLSGSRVISP